MQDELKEPLGSADRAFSPPALSPKLAERIRQRYRRRQAVKYVSISLIFAMVGLIFLTKHPSRPDPQISIGKVDHARFEEALLESTIAAIQRNQKPTRPVGDSIEDLLAAERDRASLTMVYLADAMHGSADNNAFSVDTLHRIRDLFPDSVGAQLAFRRMNERNIPGDVQ